MDTRLNKHTHMQEYIREEVASYSTLVIPLSSKSAGHFPSPSYPLSLTTVIPRAPFSYAAAPSLTSAQKRDDAIISLHYFQRVRRERRRQENQEGNEGREGEEAKRSRQRIMQSPRFRSFN